MGASTGRAIRPPAGWRSITPAGTEARATRIKRPRAKWKRKGTRPALCCVKNGVRLNPEGVAFAGE